MLFLIFFYKDFLRIEQPYARSEHKHQNDGKLRQTELKNKSLFKVLSL